MEVPIPCRHNPLLFSSIPISKTSQKIPSVSFKSPHNAGSKSKILLSLQIPVGLSPMVWFGWGECEDWLVSRTSWGWVWEGRGWVNSVQKWVGSELVRWYRWEFKKVNFFWVSWKINDIQSFAFSLLFRLGSYRLRLVFFSLLILL